MGIMDGNCFFDGSCHIINDWNEKDGTKCYGAAGRKKGDCD